MDRAVKTRRGLTTERVVEAALQLADEEGLEAVTVRRLAKALGVTPMSIYRHVRDKSHLLDLMADELLAQVDLAAGESATWQDRLRRVLASFQAVIASHPATPQLISRPLVSPASLRGNEALLAILRSAGFDAAQSVLLLQVIAGMIIGPAINRATWARASTHRPLDAERMQMTMGALSADQFPNLASTLDQFLDWSAGADADRLAIELVVGGMEALADQPPGVHGMSASSKRG